MDFERTKNDPVGLYESFRGAEAGKLAALPPYMQPGIVRYVVYGVKPGSFLLSVFAGEQELAERRADTLNKKLLPLYAEFLGRGCPPECWGSSDKVRAWIESGGLVGHLQREAS